MKTAISRSNELYEDGISFDDEIGYRKDKIAEVPRLGYEYYIYDFGIFGSLGFLVLWDFLWFPIWKRILKSGSAALSRMRLPT